jgi:hypothetical protein
LLKIVVGTRAGRTLRRVFLVMQSREGNPAPAGTDLEKPGNFQARHAWNVAGEVLHLVGKFFIDAP